MINYVSMRVLDFQMNDVETLKVHPQIRVMVIRLRGLEVPLKLRMQELPSGEKVLVAPPLPQGFVKLLRERLRWRLRV